MKIRTETVIDMNEWDKLVSATYGRPYKFQQQEGCKDRGNHRFSVPDESEDDPWPDAVPEVVNHEKMGVNFAAWLARDPKQKLPGQTAAYELDLWWSRNFYPPFQEVANDLCKRGLLEAGKYTINIDW